MEDQAKDLSFVQVETLLLWGKVLATGSVVPQTELSEDVIKFVGCSEKSKEPFVPNGASAFLVQGPATSVQITRIVSPYMYEQLMKHLDRFGPIHEPKICVFKKTIGPAVNEYEWRRISRPLVSRRLSISS